ncbi:MAG: cupredoxin domain-containing protein [Proteobacteria bacterium]|nr:cupredoxin domain-containing protein [Pseudomonadota bacterium]
MIRFISLLIMTALAYSPFAAFAQAINEPFKVTIEKRKVVGERVLRVKKGDTVRLQWRSDEQVEVHVHGYNIKTEIKPGAPSDVTFTARATGRYPVTSHGFGTADERKKKSHNHGHGLPGSEAALIYIEVLPN